MPGNLTPFTIETGKKEGKPFSNQLYCKEDKLKEQAQLDGILCFLTNDKALTPQRVITSRKNIIEDTFHELKSSLCLRPFHLISEERVKAHVSICVLSYLLLNALEESLLDEPPSRLTGP